MFAIVKDALIVRLIPDSTAFSYEGTNYSSDFLRLASPADKARLGIVDVVYGKEADMRFYWVSPLSPVYDDAAKVVRIDFLAKPRDLDECKKSRLADTNSVVYSLLIPSDYRAVRAFEQGTPEDPLWKEWRQVIRDQATSYKAAIEGCATVEELALLPPMEWKPDPSKPQPPVELPIVSVELPK